MDKVAIAKKAVQAAKRKLRRAEVDAIAASKNSALAEAAIRSGVNISGEFRQQIERAFRVKAKVKHDTNEYVKGCEDTLSFTKGKYRYEVAVGNYPATQFAAAQHHVSVAKTNVDKRYWSDWCDLSVTQDGSVVSIISALKKLMHMAKESGEDRVARLLAQAKNCNATPLAQAKKCNATPLVLRYKAMQAIYRLNVLPVGAVPCIKKSGTSFETRDRAICLSLAKGKVCWHCWTAKGKHKTVDMADKSATKQIRSFFRSA